MINFGDIQEYLFSIVDEITRKELTKVNFNKFLKHLKINKPT